MITPRYPPERCGVGDYTALLAQYLAKRGISMTVVTSRRLISRDVMARHAGVQVKPLIEEWGWGFVPRLARFVAAGHFDVVHVQYQNEMYGRSASVAALPVALRAARLRVPVVVTVHDYGTPWPRHVHVRAVAGPYGKAWFAAMLLASARVVLTNEQDEWRFLRQRFRYPVPASRYTTIPVGSNLPVVMPPRLRPHDSPITVGYFGFVNPAKGVDTLLDAFARAHRLCQSLHLRLICTLRADDPYHRALLRRLDANELRGAVTVTGDLDDAEAAFALAGCDVVALPFRDGISLRRTTLMAALALGCAVISTRSAVAPAMLCDGRDVVLVPPSDAVALAQAIVGLARDSGRREALGQAAREVASHFSWPSIAAQTADLYRQVLV